MFVGIGQTWDESRWVDGRLVRIVCENTTDETLYLDGQFVNGLFQQAVDDGESEYEWEFDPPVRATVT